jgi:hypothetical protein
MGEYDKMTDGYLFLFRHWQSDERIIFLFFTNGL